MDKGVAKTPGSQFRLRVLQGFKVPFRSLPLPLSLSLSVSLSFSISLSVWLESIYLIWHYLSVFHPILGFLSFCLSFYSLYFLIIFLASYLLGQFKCIYLSIHPSIYLSILVLVDIMVHNEQGKVIERLSTCKSKLSLISGIHI